MSDVTETTDSYRVTAGELRQFVEVIEQQEAERVAISAVIKESYDAAKSAGYDAKVLRKFIALRKRDAADISEEEALLQMMVDAVGL